MKKNDKSKEITTPSREQLIAVLVTNKLRGVYFGYARGLGVSAMGRKKLYYAKHCFSYAKGEHGGTYDLAVSGPADGSRCSPSLDVMTIGDVANVVLCTPEAAARWEAAGWGK